MHQLGDRRDMRCEGGGVTGERRRSARHLFRVSFLVILIGSLFGALAPMNSQGAGGAREKPMMTKNTIIVEHIRIESAKSFADVRSALERNVPQLDPDVVKALVDGEVERIDREREQGPQLSIFRVRDHGALLKIAGKARNALQYDIGNSITASLMTRHRLSAALYAPIRVVLYENDVGHGVFEYDSHQRHLDSSAIRK